jgi:hypothetical protein
MNLSEILPNAGDYDIDRLWQNSEAAPELEPLPRGNYVCRVESGELFTAGTGTKGYRLKLRVHEGPHAERVTSMSLWLTEAAMPNTRRELAKIGIREPRQLSEPIPPGPIVSAQVVHEAKGNGEVFHKAKSIQFLRVEKPQADPFAPRTGQAGTAVATDGGAS